MQHIAISVQNSSLRSLLTVLLACSLATGCGDDGVDGSLRPGGGSRQGDTATAHTGDTTTVHTGDTTTVPTGDTTTSPTGDTTTSPTGDTTTSPTGDTAAPTEGDANTSEPEPPDTSLPADDDAATTEADDTTNEVPEGACTNVDDQAVIDDPDTDVTAVATEYAYACLTSDDIGACTAEGVTTDTGLSTDCALCYAEQVVCAAENCLGDCISDSEAQACVDCRNENCVPLFEPCSGIAPSSDE